MQASSTALVLLICCLNCFAIQVSSLDTLEQGPDNLNSSSQSQLVSANTNFTLGFYTPDNTNNTYLALWLTDLYYMHIVWIGNRENPIPSNASAVLKIGSRGEMTITYDGGEAIEIYGGGSGEQNVTATLLDSGNFVLKSNVSSSAVAFLWESFDHPIDTLLPGMKIGVNHKTGRNWKLSSWLGSTNPAPGAFTLEWDPSEVNFLVRRRGEVFWRSGELKYYYDEDGKYRAELDNFNFVRDPYKFYFNFTSDGEGYLIFSLIPIPLSAQTVLTGWKLDDEGDIYNIERPITIARPSLCYSNYYKSGPGAITGCAVQCVRTEHQRFTFMSGDFKGEVNTTYDRNSSLSLSDCMEVCWNDCECVAYADGFPGCLYWKGQNLEFVQSVAGTSIRKYFLETTVVSVKSCKLDVDLETKYKQMKNDNKEHMNLVTRFVLEKTTSGGSKPGFRLYVCVSIMNLSYK